MRALYFDGDRVALRDDYPQPVPRVGEALLHVSLAGICATDLEVARGYADHRGVMGHEFVGTVVQCPARPDLEGRRVVAEINIPCGECSHCRGGRPTHCLYRQVVGIRSRDGVFADYVALPIGLLHLVPAAVADTQAVFVEPLAAACRVGEMVQVRPSDTVVVLGGGRLGLLVAQVLRLSGCDLTVVGRREASLARAQALGFITCLRGAWPFGRQVDMVVECTGSVEGAAAALALVRPQGTLVLKSTTVEPASVDLTRVVVDEISLVGSRCGPFDAALRLLEQRLVDPTPLIDAVFGLDQGLDALALAGRPGRFKVLLQPDRDPAMPPTCAAAVEVPCGIL